MARQTGNYGWILLLAGVILILLNTISESKSWFGATPTGMATRAFSNTASQFAVVTIGIVFLIGAVMLLKQRHKREEE